MKNKKHPEKQKHSKEKESFTNNSFITTIKKKKDEKKYINPSIHYIWIKGIKTVKMCINSKRLITMRNTILLCFLFLANVVAWGQKVEFVYDNAGNRTTRQIVTLKSATLSDSVFVTKETIGEKKIKLYPNPTGGILTMDINNLEINEEVSIQVTDLSGHILLKEVQTCSNFKIDLTERPNGFYILTTIIGKERKEWKIIKE